MTKTRCPLINYVYCIREVRLTFVFCVWHLVLVVSLCPSLCLAPPQPPPLRIAFLSYTRRVVQISGWGLVVVGRASGPKIARFFIFIADSMASGSIADKGMTERLFLEQGGPGHGHEGFWCSLLLSRSSSFRHIDKSG